jgi:hypothetical protein
MKVAMTIVHVWKDMEVSTIARLWAKSKILDSTMEADIRAVFNLQGNKGIH